MRDIIARSRNVGTAKIAAMLAPRDTQKAAHLLYDFWDRVGLVGRTGVDIASEEAGISWIRTPISGHPSTSPTAPSARAWG